MVIDSERVQLLVYKYAGKCEEAWAAQRAMNAANKEANAVMDEITAYLEEANASNEKMGEELVRLQKAEEEWAAVKAEPTPPALAPIVPCILCRRWKALPEAGEHAGWCHLWATSREDTHPRCSNFESIEISDSPTRIVDVLKDGQAPKEECAE